MISRNLRQNGIYGVNQISGALHRMFDGLIDLADAPPDPRALSEHADLIEDSI